MMRDDEPPKPKLGGLSFAAARNPASVRAGLAALTASALAVERRDRDRPQIRGGVAGIAVDGLVDGVAVAGEQQGRAVGRGAGDRLGRDVGARARPVLDHDLEAGVVVEFLRHHARQHVDAAARRKADDHGDLLARSVARLRQRRRGRERQQQAMARTARRIGMTPPALSSARAERVLKALRTCGPCRRL